MYQQLSLIQNFNRILREIMLLSYKLATCCSVNTACRFKVVTRMVLCFGLLTGRHWFPVEFLWSASVNKTSGGDRYTGKTLLVAWSFQTVIGDVANSKRHQRLDEILIIFTRTIQEISKVVCEKNYVRNARIYTKLMLYEMCALQQAYAAQTELR